MGVMVEGVEVSNIDEYNKAVQSRREFDECRPYAAVVMLADSQLLFSKTNEGIDWIERVKCELPSRALSYDGFEQEIHASYIGTANGDLNECFEVFKAAMEKINITNCMHIHAENITPVERTHLELSDVILLAGGDHHLNYSKFNESQYLSDTIRWRYYSGAVVIGIAEGCRFLGKKFWISENQEHTLHNGISIVPLIINSGSCNEMLTIEIVKQNGIGSVAMHIPRGGGLIFNTDGHFEAVGKNLISEIHYRHEDGEPLITNYLAPPECGDGILVRMKEFKARLLKRVQKPLSDFVDDPDNTEEGTEENHLVEASNLKCLGTEAFSTGNFTAALSLYQRAQKANRNSIEISMNITLCLTRLHKLKDALTAADYTMTIPGGVNTAKCWYRRGIVFCKLANNETTTKEHEYLFQAKCDFENAQCLAPLDATVVEELKKLNNITPPEIEVTFIESDEVSLSECRIRSQRVKMIEKIIIDCQSLHLLDLSNCHLGDIGVREMLKKDIFMTSVTKLNLSNNSLSDSVLEKLLEGVRDGNVKSLDLSNNNFSFSSIMKIAHSLTRTLSSLESINLSYQRPSLTVDSLWRLAPLLFIEDITVRDVHLNGLRMTASAKQRLHSMHQASNNRCRFHCSVDG